MDGLNTIVKFAIIVIVVIVALFITRGIAEASFVNLAKALGFDVGPPSVSAFSITPTPDGSYDIQLSIGGLSQIGGDGNVVLEITRNRADDSASAKELLAQPNPSFDRNNIIYSSDNAVGGLKSLAKNGRLSVNCPTETSKGCLDKGRSTPGWYVFSAVLKRGSKVISSSKDVRLGLYNEEYVELLNRPIAGCNDPGFGNCNVIECKKTLINTPVVLRDLLLRKTSGVADKISGEFRKERGLNDPNNCGKAEPSGFKLDDCKPGDIDALNIKVARARLLELASAESFADPNGQVKSEDQYVNYLGRITADLKALAIKATMSCTEPYKTFPKGAYAQLNALGWQPIPVVANEYEMTGHIWESKVSKELNDVLAQVKPGISNLKAQIGSDNKLIGLSWEVPIGTKEIQNGYVYSISNSYIRWGGGLTAENMKVKVWEKTISAYAQDSDKVVTSISVTDGQDVDRLLRMGNYTAEITLQDGGTPRKEISSAAVSTGLFNDYYIETYKGRDSDCVVDDKDTGTKADNKCNVDAIKRYALSLEKKEAMEAYQNVIGTKNLNAECQFPTEGLSNRCSPEDVDKVYHEYLVVRASGSKDKELSKKLYDCDLTGETITYGASEVCAVKRQVVNTLNGRHWKDLRLSKGWDPNV